MINNIPNVDANFQKINTNKATSSRVSLTTPPLIAFKTPLLKQKATLRVKKFKRSDNIIIAGDIDENYVDIIEEEAPQNSEEQSFNFFQSPPQKKKTKILKDCYVIDFIQSPRAYCGMGTEAVKGLAEKAMFDKNMEGRIVTFSSPVWRESSPALFFYKLGFRFIDPAGNDYMEECLIKKVPDIPPQIGMMYLPKYNLHKLLRYGELF